MRIVLLLCSALLAVGLAGCAVRASVPGASFAVSTPGHRHWYGRRYPREGYAPYDQRPHRDCD